MRISPTHIEPEMGANERFEAIRELLLLLVRAGTLSRDVEPAIFTACSQREEIMSTGIGFGLAFPHAEADCLSRPTFAFGRSRTGIEFDSLDGMPVEFVFVFILPTGMLAQGKTLMPRVSCRLNDRRTRERLRRCSTAQEISDILAGDFFDDDQSA